MKLVDAGRQEVIDLGSDKVELNHIVPIIKEKSGSDVVVFCRVEIGQKSYHIICSTDPGSIPAGTQVLIG